MYAQHKGAASAKEGEVSVITFTAEFRKELRDAKGPVIVDWTASWCGPCKNIAPVFAQYASEYRTVRFLKVDVDQNRELAAEYGINAMPTFHCINNGSVVDEVRGMPRKV